MYKCKITPDTAGFTVTDGQTTIATQLEGGKPRVRLDKIGAVKTVTCQWTVGPCDYNYLSAFYRTGTVYGSMPFAIDLVGIDGSTVETYTATFVPNTWKLTSQTGLTYVQSCSMWVEPLLPGECIISTLGTVGCKDAAILGVFTLPTGKSYAWAGATTTSASTGADLSGGTVSGLDVCATVLTQTSSRPLGYQTIGATWKNFVMPTLPAGATITGIYPAVMAVDLTPASGVRSTLITAAAAPDMTGEGGSVPSDGTVIFYRDDLDNAGGDSSHVFLGASLGTDPSTAVTGMQIGVFLRTSLFLDDITERLAVTFVTLLVCYV